MILANLQAIENKQVVVIAIKSVEEKRGAFLGFSVRKLLKTSIEKMSTLCFAIIFVKTGTLSYACHYVAEKKGGCKFVRCQVSVQLSIAYNRQSTIENQPLPKTGTATERTERASSLNRKRMTCATSSVETHCEKSALGMSRRFAGVSMVPGRMQCA